MARQGASGEKELYFVGVLAWLIPGAGYWLLGLRDRAVVVFVAICGTFMIGLALGSVEMIDPANEKVYFAGQILCGLPAIGATMMQSPTVVASSLAGRGVNLGQLYTAMAGLLNLLCIIDGLFRAHVSASVEAGSGKK